MSSDRNSSGIGSADGGTGVPFSGAARLRPLRATFLRPTVFRAAVFRAAVLRVAILRPAVFLRAADFRPVVFRAAVLRVAVLRPAVLRAPFLRATLLRTADLRPAVLRVTALRRVVFRAPVLRGRPGLRLLGMTPSIMLFDLVSRIITEFQNACRSRRPGQESIAVAHFPSRQSARLKPLTSPSLQP